MNQTKIINFRSLKRSEFIFTDFNEYHDYFFTKLEFIIHDIEFIWKSNA